jgi:hypothetical protein
MGGWRFRHDIARFLVVAPQPSFCWRVTMTTFSPGRGSPYLATYRVVIARKNAVTGKSLWAICREI